MSKKNNFIYKGGFSFNNNFIMKKSAEKKFDVTGIGCSAWDYLGIVKTYPQPGEKSRMKRFEGQGGGQIATALVSVARLGGKAAIIDTVGDDLFGINIRKGLVEEGIDDTFLITDPGKESLVALCMIPENSGNRAIFFTKGTKKILEPEEVPKDIIIKSNCLLADDHHRKASAQACHYAREANIPVVTDIERDNICNDELFHLGTHHIIPEDYLLKYTQEKDLENALKAIKETYKPEIVITTMGDRGSMAYNGKEFIRQDAHHIAKVIDTTGAGDVFHGTFCYGLSLGYDLKTNLQFSSLIASMKCRKLGGQAGIPYIEELNGLWNHPLK